MAAGSATVAGSPVHCADLAVRGRLLESIVTGQLTLTERAVHVFPWLLRRVVRRSARAGRTGKHLDRVQVAPAMTPDPRH